MKGATSPSRRWRAYGYTLVTTAVVLVFAFGEWWTEKYISDRSRLASTTIEVAIVLIAALAVRPIHQRVEAAIEAAFTKRRREAREALARLQRELTSFNDKNQLLRRAIESVDHNMEAVSSAIYLRRDVYRVEASSFDGAVESVDLDDALAIRLRSTASPANPQTLNSSASGTLAFPMTVAGELVGFLALHPKHGEYEPEDVHALAAFAQAAGIALVAIEPQLRAQAVGVANNLPSGLPTLIGRDEELAEIKLLLDQSRLVTLTGAGGVGKTRTALHVASEMIRNPDGVWFVDLAPLDDASLVPSAIAEVFDVADEGGARRLIERIATALKAKHLLIVLDNCEHLVSAAAQAADYLLQNCPRVQILATSREPLGVPGEEPYRMPSLPVPPEGSTPDAQSAIQYGAVALFVARAHSAQRSFELTDGNAAIVADIVRRLDGIALAIELAAPRIKVLSVEQLTQRLDERFKLLSGGARTARPRHQTLRALIGWSYDLLNEDERKLLRRSSIFRGSWTLAAAEAVCGDELLPASSVLDLLEALVDKSLVAVQVEGDEQRYRLLESTRQFALERLDEAGERVTIAQRHCRYFAEVATAVGEAYWKTDSVAWIALARRDLENHRAAIAWGFGEGGDAVAAATIVGSFRWLWYATARVEGSALLARAAALTGPESPARMRGLLSLTAAVLNDSAQGALPAAEAASVFTINGDELGRAEALSFEGTALGRAGHLNEALAVFDSALHVARASGIARLTGWLLNMAAYWAGAAGDSARARSFFDEAAAILRDCDDQLQLARLQLHRAEFLFSLGDSVDALKQIHEAEAVFRARRADTGLCISLGNAAAYLLALHRFGEAWESAREALDLALRADNAMSGAFAIGHLAEVSAETGDVERAARLLGHVNEAYKETGSAREPTEQRGYDRTMQLVRAALEDDRISALLSEGAAMPREMAAVEAMSIPQPFATKSA